MKVNVDDISKTEKKIEVTIPLETVKEKRDSIFNQVKSTAKVKGFRPGKAPNHIIESMYGGEIRDEVISKLVSDTFEEAIAETSLTPINRPDIQPGEIDLKSDFTYTAVFEILPEIELADYTGLELQKDKVEVKADDVHKTIERLQKNNAQSQLVEEDREVKEGDFVFVDYTGTLEDGKIIDDLKKENVKFVVGEGQLIPEFEENILGRKKGDESAFSVSYPEDFSLEEVKGKKVDFVLKINEIHERILPELNDDFAKDLGVDSFSELKEKINSDMHDQIEQSAMTKLKQQAMDKLEERNDFDIPLSLIQSEEVRLKRQFITDFQNQGMQIPPITDEMNEKFNEKAISSVKSSIILNEIAKKEGVEATLEEINERIQRVADSYQVPFETVRDMYEKNNMIENFESSIINDKVLELVIEKANVSEVEPTEETTEE